MVSALFGGSGHFLGLGLIGPPLTDSLPLGSPHSIILFTDPRCESDYHSSLTGFCAAFQALAAASRAGSSVWAGAW